MVADPSGSWEPSTAEQYIDQQVATLNTGLASEAIARQTGDNNLSTQLNSEMNTRASQDANLNALINAGIREGGGVQFDIVPTQNSANGITSGGMYNTLRDSNVGFVDDVPTPASENLVKSGGVVVGINNLGRKEGFLFSESISRGNYVALDIKKGNVIHFSFSGSAGTGLRGIKGEDVIIPQGSTSVEMTYVSTIDITQVQAVYGNVSDFSIEVLERDYYKDIYLPTEVLAGSKSIVLSKLDFESGNIQPDGTEVVTPATIRTIKTIPIIQLSYINYNIEDNYRLDFHYDIEGTHYHTNWLTGSGTFNVPLFVHEFRLVIARPSGSSIIPDFDNISLTLSTANYKYERGVSNADLDAIRLQLLKNGFAEISKLKRVVSIPYYAKKNDIIHISFSGSAGTGMNLKDINGELAHTQVIIPDGSSSVDIEVSPFNDVVSIQAAYGDLSDISMRIVGKRNDSEVLQKPLYAPSPQLPAGSEADADFDAENLTPEVLYSAYDNLIDELSAPMNSAFDSPKFGTLNSVQGDDASGTFKLRTYVFTKRNRFAWKHSDRLYAWKSSGNVVLYTDSCSPRIGDVLYSDYARTASGKTVSSYDASTQSLLASDSVTYSRYSDGNISPDICWSTNFFYRGNTTPINVGLYGKDGVKIGDALYVDDSHVSLNNKIYERCASQDYHTDNKMTVFLWANEHGAQSDPLEPAIILYRLAKDLCYGCRNNDFISFLKNYCKVVILPCANPWGVNEWSEYKRQGRNNYNNVNINRNYDTPGWSEQSDSDKGTYAGDQNETQYIMNMCLDFEADIAVDIHCLGYVTQNNQGQTHFEGYIPSSVMNGYINTVLVGFGFSYTSYGESLPETTAQGASFIRFNGISGGLIEMNAGKYSSSYNGKQHTPFIMEADYTLLLNTVRMWMYGVDPELDLSIYQTK